MINTIFIKQGEAPEVVVVDGTTKCFQKLIGTDTIRFDDIQIGGIPFYIASDKHWFMNLNVIPTVLVLNGNDDLVNMRKGSVVITRRDVEAQCGSLSDDDIDMIMSRIEKGDNGVYYLTPYKEEAPYLALIEEF